jgi:tricorn protease
MEAGYYRFPTIHHETVVFVCEEDLWSVPRAGGIARRLTSNLSYAMMPALSPDGEALAFTGQDEGEPEVYLMPAAGGPAKRLTYLGATSLVVGWTPDGQAIIFASNTAQPFDELYHLYTIPVTGGQPQRLPTGPARSISYGPGGGMVIGRHTTDLAHWKRYRGGLTGDLWLDPDGSGEWRRLIELQGNVAGPLWIGERIYFVSDHEGIGNLYSCRPQGNDLRRHTHHTEYYVRHPATDGRRIIYHAGAELYTYDLETDQNSLIPIEWRSPRVHCNRKFVEAEWYLQDYSLHPQGHSIALTCRGKPFAMANWEGPVVEYGASYGVRYRLAAWLKDGTHLVMISDATGEEALELHAANASQEPERLATLDIGRAIELLPSPTRNQVALSNHRHELILVDLEAGEARQLDRSQHYPIEDIAWSPDGRWLAYTFHSTQRTSCIKLCLVETGETWVVTRPVLRDEGPAFDPEGKYLYFLSCRDFDPVYDSLHFDLNFPLGGMRPYLITLQADLPSPFLPVPRAPGEKLPKTSRNSSPEPPDSEDEADEDEAGGESSETEEKKEAQPIQIDLEGITERVLAFPVPEGHYGQIRGLKGKVIYSSFPVESTLGKSDAEENRRESRGYLELYDFEEQSDEFILDGVTDFDISPNAKTLIYQAGRRLRVIKAGEKPDTNSRRAGRKSGWLDLNRIKISVQPQAEWEQMYREAWRLQRDHFWTEDMSGVDWQTVYRRYLPLVRRIATRAEFSDLMREMQGELGTSHAYVYGGDFRPQPVYQQGFLGADLAYDPETGHYYLAHIVRGDGWNEKADSPLRRPGLNVEPGDRLVAVNGRKVGQDLSPQELLVNQAGNEVLLTIAKPDLDDPQAEAESQEEGSSTESGENQSQGEVENEAEAAGEGEAPNNLWAFFVRALRSETPARYREWVETNRQKVYIATEGRVGYIHIPDMGPHGYAEFHRGYLAEVEREGLIIDVRFNGGGHVSQLLLEKLARRRLGYDVQRWGAPTPYPRDSLMGPMVALINEEAGSDGDVFSHAFKLLGLGPLIGKRTWGGVIGISVHNSLVDGGVTTQPEFSTWFTDVGWGIENYGVAPDIEVEIRPQDYAAGRDPQLERAIAEIQQLLTEHPPKLPDFGNRPRLALPTLPGVEE